MNAERNTKAGRPLPRFSDPPVIETVVGVEFAPLAKWDIPHFGLFWHEVEQQFPRFRVQPPLESQIERFGRPTGQSEARVLLSTKPELRCWFLAADDRTLIQVQNNRFIFNWKKEAAEDKYPHYDQTIRPAFCREWSRFRRFVESRELGELLIVQCEITYINHLDAGKGWSSASDLPEVFPCWSGQTSGNYLPNPEDVTIEARYALPNQIGRLRVSARPAIRNSDGAEIIQLNLTARGEPRGSDDDAILSWIDSGREWVVRGFTDFTSAKMHRIWNRSQ
jgi:uncharacterized protein (TIGR04255 family)